MPISVAQLIIGAGLPIEKLKKTQWLKPIPESGNGIYIISLSDNPRLNKNCLDNAPLDFDSLNFWINKVPTIQIDKTKATTKMLANRLQTFWQKDENILYIGKVERIGGIQKRVKEYYTTELGQSSPHAGGHWLKTLSNLNSLYVYYLQVDEALSYEKILLKNYMEQISKRTISQLFDKDLPIPFANIEFDKANRKKHFITKCVVKRPKNASQ